MASPQIVTTATLCTSFPDLPTPTVSRDYLLIALETMLAGEPNLVFLEGDQGTGKTILLAQFAQKYVDRTVSVFIKPTSWFTSDPGILSRDLINQMNWIASKQELAATDGSGNAVLRKAVYELLRFSGRSGKKFIFVIDGLTSIPQERQFARDAILQLIPFGYPQFKFIFSGDSNSLISLEALKGLIWKTFPVPPFSREEARQLFNPDVSTDFVSSIYTVCKGLPGYLGSVKRLLESGVTPEQLLADLPGTLPGLFDVEWKKVDDSNTLQSDILAFLAHDKHPHSLNDLEVLFNVPSLNIRQALDGLTFVSLPFQSNAPVDFVSDPFRSYAAQKLWREKRIVMDKVVDALLKHPESGPALKFLPAYLSDTARDQTLLEYLSPDRFERILATTEQLSPLQQTIGLGLRTAEKLNKDEDLFRFGIQSSTAADLNGFDVSRAEIEALMAVGQIEKSESLAQGCVLKEDRLRLLAVIARKKKELGLSIETEFLLQLEEAFKGVDWRYLSKYASELAGDLIYSRPDLATTALEQAANASTRSKGGREKQLDWALLRLSLQTETDPALDPTGSESVRQQIKDPQIQQFARAASALVRSLSSQEIIEEVDKLSDPLEKLFLLRQWTLNAVDPSNIAVIIEFALTLGIQTTQYTPNATHLRELASGLQHIQSLEAIEPLLRMFDAQRSTVAPLGPTLDYTRLQLLLAGAEACVDFSNCASRLIDTYLYVESVSDLSTKCSALAYFISDLFRIDKQKRLETDYKLHSTIENDFRTGLHTLLNETAEHEVVTREIVSALAHTHTEMAVDIATALNIEYRRDDALHAVITAMLKVSTSEIKFGLFPSILAKFADIDEREDALDDIMGRLATAQAQDIASVLDSAKPLFNIALKTANPKLKIRMSCGIIQILMKVNDVRHEGLKEQAKDATLNALSQIDDVWERVDAAFEIATMLSSDMPGLANEYLKMGETLRGSVGLANSGKGFRTALKLAVRAYSGLVANNVDIDEDLKELKTRIERVDSGEERIVLWSEIAAKLIRDGRDGPARRIVENEIWPMLRSMKAQFPYIWQACILHSIPVLYKIHSKSALETLKELPVQERDPALKDIALFIIRREPSWESYESLETDVAKLSWGDCLDLCEVMETAENDALIYGIIRIITRSIKKGRTDLTAQQKADLSARMNQIIATKFPSHRFIRHDGFKIISKAHVMLLTRSQLTHWQQLKAETTLIPNRADRVYILVMIAQCCRGTDIGFSEVLIREAKTEADQVPALIDRVNRLVTIAEIASDIDVNLSRACIREGLELCKKQDGEDFEELRRNLIDLAYGINPELASTLISSLDDDPVRQERRSLNRHLHLRDLQKKLLEGSTDEVCSSLAAEEDIPKAAWMSLGALTGGKATPLHLAGLRKYLEFAAHLPLRRAYPILCWCIENASRRRQTGAKGQAQKTLRGIFSAALLGCDVSDRLSAQVTARFEQAKSISSPGRSVNAVLISPGDRVNAMAYLREWLESKAAEYLKICDPFLGPDEVADLLQLIQGAAPALAIYILTSRKNHLDKKITQPFSEVYLQAWRQRSVHAPPETQVVIASLEGTNESPIHDRWFITKGAGLRLGTSFNGFGIDKGAEISQMDSMAIETNETELQNCLLMRRRYKGKAVSYESFNL